MSIKSIRERAEAATFGPWEDKHPPGDSWVGSPFKGPIDAYRHTGSMGGVAVIGVRMDPTDAAFIAHARTDIPALLRVAEALGGLGATNSNGDWHLFGCRGHMYPADPCSQGCTNARAALAALEALP